MCEYTQKEYNILNSLKKLNLAVWNLIHINEILITG